MSHCLNKYLHTVGVVEDPAPEKHEVKIPQNSVPET